MSESIGILCSSVGMQDNFRILYLFPNCLPVTLKCAPGFWQYPRLVEVDLMKYLTRVGIDYLLCKEVGQGHNLHYHGILIFPTDVSRKRFQSWFNKSYGKFYVSEKGDPDGWYNYIMKGYPLPQYDVPYLFDDQYDPMKGT